MNYNTFTKNFGNLCSFFGKKLTEDQTVLWWDKFKNSNDNWFEEAINFCIENNKTFPTINDLKSANVVQKKETFIPVDCPICNGSGFVSIVRRLEFYMGKETYAATRCNCANGDRLSNSIMRYDYTMEKV